MKAKRIGFAALMLLVVAGLAPVGCNQDPTTGYTIKSPYRTDIRTVSVPMITRGKDVYRRRIEMRLTEALAKRIEMDTPYKVTKPERADTELKVTLDQIIQQVLTINPDDGLPRETEVTLVVSFRWKDLRNGRTIRAADQLRIADVYAPSQPLSEPFFIGQEGAVNKAAIRIVERLQDDW